MEQNTDECHCTVNEIELFDPIPKQIVLDKGQWVDIYPTNNISSDGPIEFEINGSPDEMIDLSSTMLQVRVKIVKTTGAALTGVDAIAPVNNWLHSLFSDVILSISGTVVEGGDHHYPYKAYLSNLLIHSQGSKNTQLQASCWFKDTAGKFNDATNNKGFLSRKKLVKESNVLEMCGPLDLDTMKQGKYLLHNTDMHIKLNHSKPQFQTHILTAAGVDNAVYDVKVVILKAVLHIRRVKALPSFTNDIEQKLNFNNVVYPIQRSVMSTYTIGKGSQSHSKEALFRGEMPKLIFVSLVKNNAYNGAFAENPFHFDDFKINQIGLYREGVSIPWKPFTPDFAEGLCVREYMSLIQTIEQYNKSDDIDLTISDFNNGYTVFGFNLTPDLCAAGHAQPIHEGNLRLEMSFSAALDETVNVIVLGIFDGKFEITKLRNVICSWKA